MSITRRKKSVALLWIVALVAALLLSAARGPSAVLQSQGATADGLRAGAFATTRPDPRVAASALQAKAAGLLMADWDVRTGIPRWLGLQDPALRLPYTPSASEKGNPTAIALGFLDANRDIFKMISAPDELKLLRIEPDTQLSWSHIRLDQTYKNLPVFSHQMVVHLDEKEQVVAVTGQFEPALNAPTEALIPQTQAEEMALTSLREVQLKDEYDAAKVEAQALTNRTRLGIYVDELGKANLVWAVNVLATRPLGGWMFYVDARREAIVQSLNTTHDAKRRQTYTANNSTNIPGRLVADEGTLPRDQIAQAAHDGAGKVYDFYFNNFKRDSLDGHGMALVSSVHYGNDPQDAENAAWIGEMGQMVYGDGGQIFRPLASGLDVVGHEFTHGVIEYTANLDYESQPGALNESYADVFGVLIANSNWTVGSVVVKSPPYPISFLRSLSDPNANGYYNPRSPLDGVGQPATMSEYANLPVSRRADNGGVHINSGIPNHAAYYIGTALGRDKLAQIYYRVIANYLSPRSNFLDAANATVRAANDLYGASAAQTVRDSFAKVGIRAGGADNSPAPPPAQQPTVPNPSTGSGTPDQIPTGCVDVVVNGGFESETSWKQATKGNTGLITNDLPHSGQQSAWLGGQDQESTQAIYQDMKIPANATSVTLRYYRLIHAETSGLLGALASPAQFGVVIGNISGDIIGSVEELTSEDGDDEWHKADFDVTELAGKTIRLGFTSENPRRNISSFFVDDVAMIVCTTGQAPQAPSTNSADMVYVKGLVKDSDTGRGVSGAQVYFLKPGVSAADAAADDRVTTDEVQTYGTSDSSGVYQTNEPLKRGQNYSVIVIASGYRPIIANDGAKIPSTAQNPSILDATLRKSR